MVYTFKVYFNDIELASARLLYIRIGRNSAKPMAALSSRVTKPMAVISTGIYPLVGMGFVGIGARWDVAVEPRELGKQIENIWKLAD